PRLASRLRLARPRSQTRLASRLRLARPRSQTRLASRLRLARPRSQTRLASRLRLARPRSQTRLASRLRLARPRSQTRLASRLRLALPFPPLQVPEDEEERGEQQRHQEEPDRGAPAEVAGLDADLVREHGQNLARVTGAALGQE